MSLTWFGVCSILRFRACAAHVSHLGFDFEFFLQLFLGGVTGMFLVIIMLQGPHSTECHIPNRVAPQSPLLLLLQRRSLKCWAEQIHCTWPPSQSSGFMLSDNRETQSADQSGVWWPKTT